MKPRKQGTTYAFTGTLRIQRIVAGVSTLTAVDLTGSTLTFWMRDKGTGVTKLSGHPVVIVNQAAGTWSVTVAAADFDTAASYDAEIHEVRADGTLWVYPSDGYEDVEIEQVIS